MSHHNVTLAALIGSRICHDLISPIGAVSNGLELIGMSGTAEGPEMSLVADSAAHANARIRLFRIAFGMSSGDQTVTANEISDILSAAYSDRIRVAWASQTAIPRQLTQALFLSVLCAEQAIPYGGSITVSEGADRWIIRADAKRIRFDTGLWDMLGHETTPERASPAEVQFLLLPALLQDMGWQCEIDHDETGLTLALALDQSCRIVA